MADEAQFRQRRSGRARPWWRVFALLALVALAAGGYAGWRWYETRQSVEAARNKPAPAIPVEGATAARRDVPLYGPGIGTIDAYNTVTVRSRVDGAIEQIAFREGQTVAEGDVLARIDPRPFQAALDQAVAKKAQSEANLANSRTDLARSQQLAERAYASRQQLDTQQAGVNQLIAQVQQDQAAIDNARTQLDYTTIRAPLAGRTGLRLVDQGNIVRASDATGIVTIAQIHPIAGLFTLPERTLPQVQAALARGKVPVDALGQDGRTMIAHGELALIDNSVDRATGTIKLKAVFPNQDDRLWPGQFVNFRVLLETLTGALTVPSDAVQRGQAGLSVYAVKDDGTVATRSVKVGPIVDGVAVIEDGVSEGETVVVSGQYRLKEGAKVEVKKPDAAKTAGGSAAGERADRDAVPKATAANDAPTTTRRN
jgi:membrane fusion protein, multidrug efflux system